MTTPASSMPVERAFRSVPTISLGCERQADEFLGLLLAPDLELPLVAYLVVLFHIAADVFKDPELGGFSRRCG